MVGFFGDWTRADYLALLGIIASGFIALAIYLLQKRLSDKQKVDHRLAVEEEVGKKLYEIRHNGHSGKIQLYNAKLLNKRYFAENKRDVFWGYPYHAAELFAAGFDGLEFIVDIEKWGAKKYHKVGVVPYQHILGIKSEGDSSFSGLIIYVKPRLIQKDKYSIAYTSYRYYLAKKDFNSEAKKPLRFKIAGGFQKAFCTARYYLYIKWKHKFRKSR